MSSNDYAVIATAHKVTMREAERAFRSGRGVLVTERPEGDTRPVTRMTTVNRQSESYRWESLAESVRMWRSRYPRQSFYVVQSICEEDSGSLTDCRPVCDEPATHRVTYDGYGGPFVSLVCERHADHAPARHYPYSVSVEVL